MDYHVSFFSIINLTTAGALAILAVFVFLRRKKGGATMFGFLLSAMVAYSFGLGFESMSRDVQTALIWTHVQYVAIPWIPLFVIGFALGFCDVQLSPRLYRAGFAVLAGLSATTMVAQFTSGYHRLYYIDSYLVFVDSVASIRFGAGPLYRLMVLYYFASAAVSIVLMVRRLRETTGLFRRQTGLILAGLSLPTVVDLVYALGLSPGGLDVVPVAFALTALLIGYALFSMRLFDLRPLALRVVFNEMPIGCLVLDDAQRLLDSNPAVRTMLPRLATLPLGSDVAPLLACWPNVAAAVRAQRSQSLEVVAGATGSAGVADPARGTGSAGSADPAGGTGSAADARQYAVDVSVIAEGDTLGTVVLIRDVTEQQHAVRRLHDMANHDFLTGALNRHAFFDQAQTIMHYQARHGGWVAFLMFDVDHFKRWNDSHGHQAGDAVLKATSAAIAASLRASDLFCRFGGEEFLALLPDVDVPAAVVIADRIRATIAAVGSVTISIGVAGAVATTPLAVESLINQADVALYSAKESGRNRVVAAPATGAPATGAPAAAGAAGPATGVPASRAPRSVTPSSGLPEVS